jgi:hypothetical protein
MVRKQGGTTPAPDTVRDALLSALPPDLAARSKLLLAVDQFEEFRASPDAAAYVEILLHLAKPGDPRIRIILTMRLDYYFACASSPRCTIAWRSTDVAPACCSTACRASI